MEEIKEFKDKEAKIAAIGKGNELIKKEVLIKIQQAKSQVEIEVDKSKDVEEIQNDTQKKAEKRKRKMSTEKVEQKDSTAPFLEEKVTINKNAKKQNVKPYTYKFINYRKFYDDSDKAHKQPKTKSKKRK